MRLTARDLGRCRSRKDVDSLANAMHNEHVETQTTTEKAMDTTDAIPSDLIGVNEAAKLANRCHADTIRRWIFRGKLRAWRMGHRYLVSRAAVLDMIEPVEVEVDDTPKPRTLRQRRRGHRLAMEDLQRRGGA